MPKLWTVTIEEHRRAVRDATLDTTAALVAERGLASVPMSRIARDTGIGRATLYKYFPDVEAILAAGRLMKRRPVGACRLGSRLRDPGPVQSAVDLGAHDLAVGRRVVEPAQQRAGQQPASVL